MTSAERNEIVLANMGLIRGAIYKYARYMPDDDAFQVAAMGLITAAERYDPKRGAMFSTFAYQCMKTHLQRENIKRAKQLARTAREWELPEALPEAETTLHSSELSEDVERRLQHVPLRERFALRHHYGIGVPQETLATTGRRLGVCRERVRQLCESGLRRIRRGL